MRYFVTNKALESGITEEDLPEPHEDGYIAVGESYMTRRVIPVGHWHLTREEAVAKVKRMIANRRRAIKKELDKLDALRKSL